MIKPPASLTFDFDETMCLYEHYDLLDRYRGTKHQYIRRDLIQPILIRVHLHEARRDDIKLDQIIDEVIQHHENKNTK